MAVKPSIVSESRGHGLDIVLLHGWGLNSGVWQPLVEQLQKHYRVTMIDLPGHGTNHDYFPADYALESVCELIAAQVPESSTLIAWSLGGLIAQRLAITYPHKFRQLLLVATSPKFTAADDWHGIDEQVLVAFEQQLNQDHNRTLGRFLAIQAMGSESARKDVMQLQKLISAKGDPNPQALAGGLRLLREVDLRPLIQNIDVNTHRLYGRLDSLVPSKAHQAIADLHSDSGYHVFGQSSHAPFISHLEDFVAKVLEILRGPIT